MRRLHKKSHRNFHVQHLQARNTLKTLFLLSFAIQCLCLSALSAPVHLRVWLIQVMMTSSSLIDDISDELLACRICLEPLRHAKTLGCRHTFCQVCLERLQDSELSAADDDDVRQVASRRTSTISRRTHSAVTAVARLTCPVCYESCPLPPGGVCRLPDDPVVSQLYNVIERRKSAAAAQSADGSGVCEICSKSSARSRHRMAHVKCVECCKLMCSHCARLHRRTNVRSLLIQRSFHFTRPCVSAPKCTRSVGCVCVTFAKKADRTEYDVQYSCRT